MKLLTLESSGPHLCLTGRRGRPQGSSVEPGIVLSLDNSPEDSVCEEIHRRKKEDVLNVSNVFWLQSLWAFHNSGRRRGIQFSFSSSNTSQHNHEVNQCGTEESQSKTFAKLQT